MFKSFCSKVKLPQNFNMIYNILLHIKIDYCFNFETLMNVELTCFCHVDHQFIRLTLI